VSSPVDASLAAEPPRGHSRVARPFRYLVAAGFNTAFGLAVYPALLWAFPWLRVHYLIALAVERRIQRGEQRLRFLLPFRVGSNHIVRDQFPRVLHRRATSGEP